MALYPVAKIKVGKRFRKDLGDIASLARSISDIGLLHPIVIAARGQLIAGQRRLAAVKKLNWERVEVFSVDVRSILRAERDENMERKNFLPSESVAIGEALETEERKAAKRRQQKAGKKHGRGKASEKFSQAKSKEEGRAESRVASAVGMSRPTYQKAKAVVKAAESKPKTVGPIAEKMDETGKVDRAYKDMLAATEQKPKPKPTVKPKPAPATTPKKEALIDEILKAWTFHCAKKFRRLSKKGQEEVLRQIQEATK